MMTRDGRLFHIDFGHFLGNFKSKFGFKRERSPFVFTPSFAEVLSSESGELYERFVSFCCQALLVLRKHASVLITLFQLAIPAAMPELQHDGDIDWLREKLMLSKSDAEACETFRVLIQEAQAAWSTRFNFACHIVKNG
eukprot:TRINITY_DN33207_c0_g1_i1.p1 TRINITY_DN33207_c0_g1~~TRINITY_DN33207_c0_g1_i1.p1  ORF type:complete len:139 (+),score=7.17 TRINITY_DN33207_c0_g1_i1:182-598(+)